VCVYAGLLKKLQIKIKKKADGECEDVGKRGRTQPKSKGTHLDRQNQSEFPRNENWSPGEASAMMM